MESWRQWFPGSAKCGTGARGEWQKRKRTVSESSYDGGNSATYHSPTSTNFTNYLDQEGNLPPRASENINTIGIWTV